MTDWKKSVVVNATRLFDDAQLLRDHGRYASAFALAVLTLEEIGKLVLRSWDVRGTTNHIRKQRAVSSLLLAQVAVTKLPAEADQITPDLVRQIALGNNDTGRFNTIVGLKVLDKAKQQALYSDDWLETAGLYADKFTDRDVGHIFGKCQEALGAYQDQRAMKIGKAIFRVLEADDAELQSLLKPKR
jgi:AbiV family abortive infection protein